MAAAQRRGAVGRSFKPGVNAILFGIRGGELMRLRALVVSAVIVLLAVPLVGEDSSEPVRGPDSGTSYRVHGIQVLPAAGRPFSARDHIVWTRNLEDGTVLNTELYALVARDGQGRIYRERRKFVPVNSNETSRRLEILLLDPVAHTRTACNPRTRRCTVTAYYASSKFVLNPDGMLDKGTRFLTRVSLGQNVIDGVDVTGTRETLQINTGVVGNNQPLVSTRDFWYSSTLQVNLAVTRKDPRVGTQALQLVDLSMTEPDPGIFQIPAGFILQDLRTGKAKPAQ